MNKILKRDFVNRIIKRSFAKYYDRNHVWITKVEGQDMYSLGLGSEALIDLGTIKAIKFNKVDRIYTPGTVIAILEGTKSAKDIETPVTIYIEKHNQKAKDNPKLFEEAPENVWLFWTELQDIDEIKKLMTVDQYSDYVDKLNSSRRLKRRIPTHVYEEKQL